MAIFFTLEQQTATGTWIKNGRIVGSNLADAWSKAKAMRKAYKWSTPIRLRFHSYGSR